MSSSLSSSLSSSSVHDPIALRDESDRGLELHLRPKKVIEREPSSGLATSSSCQPERVVEGLANGSEEEQDQGQGQEQAQVISTSRQYSAHNNDTENLESWNEPGKNVLRLLAVYFSFFIFGLNDGAYGALVPYLETYYALSDTVVSLIFLSPLVGYTVAALLNSSIHVRFGQRGVAVLATGCHIAAYAVISIHPPYPTIVVMYVVAGFGYGLIDGGWNAWTGKLKDATAVQGFLSASYSLGATISPIVATSMSAKQGCGWYTFYWFLTGCATLSLVFLALTFWDKNGSAYQSETRDQSGRQGSSRTKEALKNKITWLGAVYFFIYFGTQIALAGWIVTFMLRVRHASPHLSGISATGFQAGQTLGRAALGLVTTSRIATSSDLRFRVIMSISLACAIALQLIFWLVPDFVVSAASVAWLGFFLGPLFPAGVVVLLKLLPRHLHVSSIGLATALGGTGGAVFPFAVGAIAQVKGVQVLQPIVLALLLGIMALWLAFPRKPKRSS